MQQELRVPSISDWCERHPEDDGRWLKQKAPEFKSIKGMVDFYREYCKTDIADIYSGKDVDSAIERIVKSVYRITSAHANMDLVRQG